MLELIFQGFMEWAYGLTLECWQYFSSSLLDIMSMDFAYLKTHVPVIDAIMTRYGIPDGDMAKLAAAIQADDAIWCFRR